MYHRHAEPGSSAAYWEAFGSGSTMADHLRFCEVDPLRPLFERFLKPGSVMLEGGCGRGQYVAYYASRGFNVIGLDFAREWLKAAHLERPALKLCAGDVGALPFADGTFDLYYSGGVVEHFEAGADRALAEARRVLKPDGVLLLSVPFFSPLRRALSLAGRSQWKKVSRAGVDAHATGNGVMQFYQYAYTIPEFTAVLNAAGLRVLGTQGYAVVWGLYDVGIIERLAARLQQRLDASGPRPAEAGDGRNTAAPTDRTSTANGSGGPVPLLKRLVVAEDDTVPIAGVLVKAARSLCANMMMYVCVPSTRDVRAA
jgi:SAM-dependent methyltransferase